MLYVSIYNSFIGHYKVLMFYVRVTQLIPTTVKVTVDTFEEYKVYRLH